MKNDDILTSEQVADMLGISRNALAARRSRGAGPAYSRTGHRTVIYRRVDVEQWLADNAEGNDTLETRVAELERRVADLEANT